jgi:septal ring factor EnvC (AmiA/AmiB activator)
MLKYGLLLTAALTAISPHSFAIERDVEIEIRRLEQMVGREQETSRQLLQDVRSLQRQMDKLIKMIEAVEVKKDELSDLVANMQNVDIANLKSGQQNLYDNIDVLNWGDKQRDCPSIKATHQQIKTMMRDDDNVTTKSLCYDGKILHLESSLNVAP